MTILNNRYRILRSLAVGGFGETFLAEDMQMPSARRCAIKQLKPVTNDPEMTKLVQKRFPREAVVLEKLGDDNNQIPQLYAYFELDGQFYLVQEWIEGVTLAEKIQKEGIQSENFVRDILINLLPVLDYVHSKKIVHRDIKPDNIILREADGKPVLIDFGAVKEAMGTVATPQGNETNSIVIGTPGFMPSEQAAGRPLYSSDLYSLGLTAIYLLTGKTPQQLELDTRSGEIVWRHFIPGINQNLADILDKSIQYHPRDRFATAKEMLEALNTNILPISPTVSSAPPAPIITNTIASLSPSIWHNHKTKIIGGLIASGVVATAIIIGISLNNSESSETKPKASTSPTAKPTSQPNTTPAVKSVIHDIKPCQAVVNDPNPPLNVRMYADTNSKVLTKLKNGTKVTVVAVAEPIGWYKINKPINGWVAGNLIKGTCVK